MKQFTEIAAFIPSAGLGTRLSPLTDDKPKALVQFGDKSMLETVLEELSGLGIGTFCVNIHHFSNLMKEKIEQLQSKYKIVISDETDHLLDTGGGLVKALHLLNEFKTVLVHNVDVFAQIDYKKLINNHIDIQADITMAVSHRKTSRKLFFKNEELHGWKNFKTGETLGEHDLNVGNYLAFSGIHLIETKRVAEITPHEKAFPLIPWYVANCNEIKIVGWKHEATKWFDLGTPERIKIAEQYLKNN